MIQERIIAALFNSTWQTIAITLLVALALRRFARTSASARCAMWTAVLVISIALPFIDYGGMQSMKPPAAAHSPRAAGAESVPTATVVAPMHFAASIDVLPAPRFEPQAVRFSLATAVQRVSQGAFFVWLAGIAFFGGRFLFAMMGLLVAKNAIEPIDAETLLRGARGRRIVRLGVSDRVAVPCLLGFVAPVIALPRVLAAELSDDDLQRIVLHESAHLERHDDWLNLIEQMALVIFFFNPAMHYIARCIGMEREIACDDRVIAKSENRITYAECLTQLARRCTNRRALSVPGFFTNRRQILIRIEQLLDRSHNGSPVVGRTALAAIGVVSLAGLLLSQVGIPVVAADLGCIRYRSPFKGAPLALQELRIAPAITLPAPAPQRRAPAPGVARVAPAAPHVKCSCIRARTSARIEPVAAREAVRSATTATHAEARSTVPVAAPVVPLTRAPDATTVSEETPVRTQDSGYSEDMSLAGYRGLSVDQLIDLHDHGVNPGMVAEFKAAGYTALTPAQLIELRDHAVSAAFAQSMNAMAHRQLDVDQLVTLRDHGVSTDYAADMSAHGLRIASVDDLIMLRDHGVSGHYLAELAQAGYGGISVGDAIRLRDHGVSAAFVAHIRHDLNPANLSIDELIRLRDAGL